MPEPPQENNLREKRALEARKRSIGAQRCQELTVCFVTEGGGPYLCIFEVWKAWDASDAGLGASQKCAPRLPRGCHTLARGSRTPPMRLPQGGGAVAAPPLCGCRRGAARLPRVALRQPSAPRVFWHFFDIFGHILGYRTSIEMSLIPLESLFLGLHF